MEILGVGLPELIFIFLLVIIIFGPKDLEKTGKTIGRWLYQLVHSDTWKILTRVSRNLTHLPTTLMRQAGLDDINPIGSLDPRPPATPPTSQPEAAKPAAEEPTTIASPPAPGQDTSG